MKISKLCWIVFPFFIGCSSTSENEEVTGSLSNPNFYRMDAIDVSPANSANPYDKVGQIQLEVIEAYYLEPTLPNTLPNVVGQVLAKCKANSSFVTLSNSEYQFTDLSRIAYLADHSATLPSEVLAASLEVSLSQNSLGNFITALLSLCETETSFNILYDYIVSYERDVIADETLSVHDKRMILTTTSIIRYSTYARKKKPKKNTDPEWTLMVGNIYAGLEGSYSSEQDAIMKAVAVGVVENGK